LARFPKAKTLDQFDFNFQPGVDEKNIRDLVGLRFTDDTETIIFTG
jgi:DNA replication protein DnaC